MRLTGSAVLALGIWQSGCVSVPPEPTYHPRSDPAAIVLWPAPPEVPRFRYAGELIGEENFPRPDAGAGVGTRLARWIVGLGGGPGRRPDRLLRPQSGIVGPDGIVYVTDSGRRAVFAFDMEAGRLDVWERADQGAPFDAPSGIALAGNGELLVADAGLGRVVRLTRDGRPVGSFGSASLVRPAGIVWSDRGIFVADAGAHDLKVFDVDGRLIGRLGLRGGELGELNGPTHLALRDGLLYVSDTLNARVQVFSADGEPLRAIGARGLYVGNFTRPKGVAVDSGGHVYVVESYHDHLVVFDDEGRYLLPISGPDLGTGAFYLPAGVWVDGQDRIFLADMYNARVLILQYLGD